MPLLRISVPAGKPSTFRKAVSDGVYAAMRETFNVPEDDHFQIVTDGHDEIVHAPRYLGIDYSDDLTIIQITCNEGRTVEQKKALYARIAQLLSRDAGLRPQDVFTNIVEVKKENWSFGNGVAQYA